MPDSRNRDAVDMVGGHQSRDVGQRCIGVAGEDAGVRSVGHHCVLEPGVHVAAVIRLDVGGGHCDVLVVKQPWKRASGSSTIGGTRSTRMCGRFAMNPCVVHTPADADHSLPSPVRGSD
jgi:hypothetical protein